ncbi:caspase family protein [Vibrio parahaemolyticus]|uniref:caspase family protein n=1 Tax=Vibrio parahaemolyticus TaxID=670 RepID=UPI0015BF5C2F|nr:caspase family protein [Vibrio parahaemolyticus]QLE30637.1 caspase family protein [Vibrio parahaemolyticus]
MNLGIVIGVEKYKSDIFDDLVACKNDAKIFSDVLRNVKDFEEILYLNENESGTEIKKNIVDFVEKYKDQNVKELIFYFSGHGERFNDDFFYLPSDFDRKKRETTGLRNSELDEWIKTISPKLCVKIVDACFSGTQYIKSESSQEMDLKKSANKYGLNDIYFWFSSRENEVSYAGSEFSRFTESILTSLLDKSGEVRYREVMDAVADDFSNAGSSKPIFVTQSSNIEKFGHISDSTHQIIYSAFGLEDESTSNGGDEKNPDLNEVKVEKNTSVFDLISKKSKAACFDEEKLSSFIKEFNVHVSNWGDEIKKAYSIDVDENIESYYVPNRSKLGDWLEKNKDKNYFANATFDTRNYEVEEYKALPRKPTRTNDALSSLRRMSLWAEEEKREYKLETVTRTERFVDGFQYSHNLDNRILKVSFEPELEIVDPICLYIVPFYSNKELIISFSYEFLKRRNWSSHSSPKCAKWRNIKVNVNAENSAQASAQHIKKELESWLTDTLSKLIE